MNGNEARVAGTMTLLWDCKVINGRMNQLVEISGISHVKFIIAASWTVAIQNPLSD